jgi:tetratricopeptide (TPR) repeat protein
LLRIENAIVTVAIYLVQIVWPANLAPFYPFPARTLPTGQVIGAGVALVAITFAAIALRRRQPWLFVGWFWYLVMLLPVIGIVQIGMQARADRYTYLPHIGIYIAGAWSIAKLGIPSRFRRQLLPAAALTFLVLLTYLAWLQTQHWRDSRTLWTHAAAVTHDNEVAENNLGLLLQQQDQLDDAISHYQRAVAIQTARGAARYNVTVALAENNLANALYRKGDLEEAIAHLRTAVELRPDYADGFYNLGTVLFENREVDAAISCFEKALALRPDDAAVHGRLGDALRQKRADAAALAHYEKALQLEPAALWAHYGAAWLLATCPDASIRNAGRALELARHALQLPGGENPLILRTLAAAYASQGNFEAAIAAVQQGMELSRRRDGGGTLRSLESDLDLYRENIPLREVSPAQ